MSNTFITLALLITFFTSCSTHKQTISREERSTLQLDSTLLLSHLVSHWDWNGEIFITPLPTDPILYINTPENPAEKDKQIEQPSTAMPYKITFDLHASRRDTLEETSISSHRAESTNSSEVEQLSTRDPNSSSWWLKFRFRALLCILLLSAPFAVVGIYRVIRVCKSK